MNNEREYNQYRHYPPYNPPRNYMEDKKKVDRHMKTMADKNWGRGNLPEMAGAAQVSEKMKKMHLGECCEVKDCLKEALMLLYMYSQTSQDIFKLFAEDSFMKAKELAKHIDDDEDKDNANHYLDMMTRYMAEQGMNSSDMPSRSSNNMQKQKSGMVNL